VAAVWLGGPRGAAFVVAVCSFQVKVKERVDMSADVQLDQFAYPDDGGVPRGGQSRRPAIDDRYADLLAQLSHTQRRGMISRLAFGFYEGWHPSRAEIADLVAVELGTLTLEECLDRQRLRRLGQEPTKTVLVLAKSGRPDPWRNRAAASFWSQTS
jgi:hypothetical protein